MARIEMPAREDLTPDQIAVCDEVINGPRGFLPSIFAAWVHNPELARRLQNLSLLLRTSASLDPLLVELIILVSSRHWTSHVEWTAHKKIALDRGMDPSICADIAARREPAFTRPKDRAAYALASALLRKGRPTETEYRAAIDTLGEKGVVDLIGLVGYFSMVSFTFNTFEFDMPESAAPELEDPEFPGTVQGAVGAA